MEKSTPNPTMIATKWSLLYLGVTIVLTYAYEFLNVTPGSAIQYISYVPFIAFCFLAQKEYKDQLGGFITFGKAFSPGFRYSLFTGLLTSLFSYLYLAVLSPGMLTKITDIQATKMAEQGQSQDIIDKAGEMTSKYGALIFAAGNAISTLIFGTIIALIVAAVIKKERSVYDTPDTTIDPMV